MIPIRKAGYTALVMSKDIPADIIHAVSVVPILAPIMTEIACANVSKPAFTNDTVITVVAVDDCTEAVTRVPVSIPVKRLVVIAPRTWRNCGPAIFCNASLMVFIPNMRSAREPRSFKRISISYLTIYNWVNVEYLRKITQNISQTKKTGKKTHPFCHNLPKKINNWQIIHRIREIITTFANSIISNT